MREDGKEPHTEIHSQKKRKRFRRLMAALLLFAVCAAFIWWDNHHFTVTQYRLSSPKVQETVRIVDLSDLHNASFGRDNEKLTGCIRELNPDLILMTGDMVTAGHEDISVITGLCADLAGIAPIFYTYGNHENEMVYGSDVTPEFLEYQAERTGMQEYGRLDFEKIEPLDARLPSALKELGVAVVNNGAVSVSLKGITADIIGADNLSGTFYPYSSTAVGEALTRDREHLKIVLAHQPSVAEALSYEAAFSYDLLLCGHRHGGIIRVPGLGGMFCEGSFWPLFSGNGKEAGMFSAGQGTVVASRGLGNSNILPRINNAPELVVIDIEKGGDGT